MSESTGARPGRPKMDPGKKRDNYIGMHCTDKEYVKFMSAVDESELSVSDFVRKACKRFIT